MASLLKEKVDPSVKLPIGVKGYADRGDTARTVANVASDYAARLFPDARRAGAASSRDARLDAAGIARAERVVRLVDAGLSGKTTLLLREVKPLIDGDERLRWVYIPCDVSAEVNSKAAFMLQLAAALVESGLPVPRLACLLRRYNVATSNSLSKAYGQYWNAVRDVAETANGVLDKTFFLAGIILMAASVAGGAIPAPAAGIIGKLIAGDGIASCLKSAVSDAVTVMGITDDAAGAIRQLHDAIPFSKDSDCVSMDASEVEQYLELALAFDFMMLGKKVPVIVLDGLERLLHGDRNEETRAWLANLIRVANAVFVLSGREGLDGLPTPIVRTVGLAPIDMDGFKRMLGKKRPRRYAANAVLDRFKTQPGVLALYCQAVNSGFDAAASEARRLAYAKEGARPLARMLRRRFGGRVRPPSSDDEIVRSLVSAYVGALREDSRRNVWEAIATLCWIPEWCPACAVRCLPAVGVASEYMDEIKGLSFIQVVDDDDDLYKVHASLAPYFRDLTDVSTWDVTIDVLTNLPERCRGDRAARASIAAALLMLRVKYARHFLGLLGADGSATPVGEVDAEALRALFSDVIDASARSEWADAAHERGWDGLLDQLEAIADIVDSERAALRGASPQDSLDYANLSIQIRDQYMPTVLDNLALWSDRWSGRKQRWTVAAAHAKREAGAILSDFYRSQSSITYHVQALELEIQALRQAVGVSKGDVNKLSVDRVSGSEVASCLNAVGMSVYRLEGYDVCIPLIDMAWHMCGARGSVVEDVCRGRVRNNRNAMRYSYAVDCLGRGISYVGERAVKLTKVGKAVCGRLLGEAVESYRGVVDGERAKGECSFLIWGNYAESLLLADDCDEALVVADELLREIGVRGGGKGSTARALTVRARIELRMAELSEDEAMTTLKRALGDAEEALMLKREESGGLHLDVAKIGELVDRIKAAMSTCGPEAGADGVKLRGAAARDGKRGETLVDGDDVQAEEHGERSAPPAVSMKRFPSAREMASRIVRGDPVDMAHLFALDRDEYEERFGAFAAQRPYEPVFSEATEADAALIADLMERVKGEPGVGDLFAISDEARVRGKLADPAHGHGALVRLGDELAAYGIFLATCGGDGLGWYVDDIEPESMAVEIDSVAVAAGYRGLGLQRDLIELGERWGRGVGCDWAAATVHPANSASIANFAAGYKVAAYVEEMFEDQPRLVMAKRLGLAA